ncbi:MAG: hypothetical protein QOJ19_1200, partial [Acidimicrobiia bacterium]|nr:hypothetical protein [Acidimicrobiia bacterium]
LAARDVDGDDQRRMARKVTLPLRDLRARLVEHPLSGQRTVATNL